MTRRPLVISLTLLSMVGLIIADHQQRSGNRFSGSDSASSASASQLAPAGSQDSTWYCVGGTGRGGVAELTVVIANVGEQERSGVVTWIPTEGQSRSTEVQVKPLSTSSAQVPAEISGPYVSAIVELDGGEVAVEHMVTGSRGTDVGPCPSKPSTTWFLADGSTARDASQFLMILNPFAADAVVDLSFATNEGQDSPVSLQGLALAPRTMKSIDLGERRRDITSTSVRSRTGQVVVERLQSFDGSTGRTGISLIPGAPSLAEVWHFPRGFYDAATTERWHIYNPNEQEAQVSIEITPDDLTLLPEPVDLVIAPGSRTTVNSSEQARVPAGAGYSAVIRSLNGVPVVAEREVDGRAAAPPRGWSSMIGAPRTASTWVFPVGESSDAVSETIVVNNPGDSALRFSVFTLKDGKKAELTSLQHSELKPGARVSLALKDAGTIGSMPLIVEASGPVAVERQLSSMGSGGSGWAMGVAAL